MRGYSKNELDTVQKNGLHFFDRQKQQDQLHNYHQYLLLSIPMVFLQWRIYWHWVPWKNLKKKDIKYPRTSLLWDLAIGTQPIW